MPFSKIVLLGDSLTQTSMEGWGGGLAHIYQRRADVLNRGMSGYNSRWFLRYALDSGILSPSSSKDILQDSRVILVTIFFGANDASLPQHNPHAAVPREEYKENVKSMIRLSRNTYPNAKILVITPPPVHHQQRLEFQRQRYREKATGVLERTLENSGLFARATVEAVKEYQNDTASANAENDDDSKVVRCLNLYDAILATAESSGEDYGKFFYDGLHFSPAGHDLVRDEIVKIIGKEFPDIAVTPCPHTGQWNNSGTRSKIVSQGPYHDEIQHDIWEAAFNGRDTAATVSVSPNATLEGPNKRA